MSNDPFSKKSHRLWKIESADGDISIQRDASDEEVPSISDADIRRAQFTVFARAAELSVGDMFELNTKRYVVIDLNGRNVVAHKCDIVERGGSLAASLDDDSLPIELAGNTILKVL